MKMVRYFSVAALASLIAHSVWAATPVAVWEGFSNLTPTEGYTIVAGEGVVGSDGVATIAAGKTLKLTADMGNQFTVVMEVSDIPGASGSNFATILDAFYANGGAHLSLDSQEGKLLHKWSHDNRDFGTANNATPIAGRNVIAFAYTSSSGEKTYINGTQVVSGGAYSSARVNRFCFGGYWGDTPTCTANGMKIYRIELYNTQLSADDVAAIKCSKSAAAGEAYVCSNLDRAETKSSHYTQNVNVNFILPPSGDCPAGTVVNVTTIKLGSPTGKSMAGSVTLAGQTGTKGTAETSATTGYTYIQPYTFATPVEIEVGKTYTFNAGGSQCTGINGKSPIAGNSMGNYSLYCSVEGTVKSIIRKGTISDDCTIATATWANGAPVDGDLVELNVTNDATLTLDSAVSYSYLKITGEGALTISDITNLGSTPIIGDGTIVIDKNGATVTGGQNDGTCDWNITGLTDAAKWTGTVWLKNVVWKNMNPATLGNENSTVRMTGVSGYSYNSNDATAGFAGTLDLVDEDTKVACTIDNAFNSTYFFGKLTGTGTFKTTGDQTSSARYAFKDASAFEGTINLAGNNKSVTIGNDIPGVGDYFAGNVIGIRPTGTATVKAGKTWSATTITVNGTLSVENTGAISGSVTGVGTLSVPAFTTVNNNTIKTALQNQDNWKGTLQILGCNSISTDALSGTASALNNYGNVNSKIEFKDCAGTSGNGNYFGTTTAALNPEIVVTGTLKLTNGYSYDGSHTGSYTIFRKLSGSGEIVDGNSAGQMFYAKDVSDFTGSITMSSKKFVIGDHANSDTSVAGGAIIVREGYAARVDGTWSGSSVTVEGGIYGTGTVSSPLTYATTATLEPERGVVTAGAAVTFGSSIKVKVSAAPEEEGTKVLVNTSVSESLVSTAVTTVIGATESSEYSLFQKQDGIYLMKVTTLEWQGENGTAIDAPGNWKGGEFNDNLTYGLFTFPACAETTIVRVPNGTADVSHISVVSGGKYKFVGEGQTWKIGALIASGATVEFENIKVDIDVSDISDYAAMKALVGANANVAMPYAAITLGAGQTLNLYAGLTLKLPIVPTLNNAATIVVENAANVAWGTNYELLSWKTCKARFTYGRPTLSGEFTTPEGAGDARLLTAAKAVWLQLRSAKQMARKPLIVWPFGDSITEGMNAPNTRANYRIQLCQKLSLAGYNVKTVGFHDRNGPGNFGTIDPSGNRITDEEWEFHSGVGGELAVRYTGNHGTLHNSWENNLDVVGDPDVVLIHIGINDIVSGSASQTTQYGYTLDEVKRLAKNLLKERPNLKVVLSSMNRLRYGQTFQGAATPDATEGNGNRYYVKPFRDALKAFCEEVKAGNYPEDYPADRVFFADMYENIRPQGYATLQPDEDGQPGLFIEGGGDNIHPDWAGHEIMAQTWFDQIVEAVPLDENGDYDCNLNHMEPETVAEDTLGAKKNVPAEYLKGFKQAKVMKLEGKERYTDGVTYVSSSVADDTVVEKVGYYIEYVVPSATRKTHRWLWVDMDAFGTNKTLSEMLLQTSGDTRKVVSNLHIASNHLAIESVAANRDGVSGMVEFYPNKPAGGGNVAGAPTHWMNDSSWNDGLGSTMYGSFQVHRTAPNDVPYAGNARPAQVLFAYNGWMAADDKPNEFGIGNFSQHWNGCTMDWINMRESKTMNATCFEAKSIEIWVKVAGEPEGPTNWDDVDDDTDVADIVSTETQTALEGSTVTAMEIASWAKALADNGITVDLGSTIPVEALILNCGPAQSTIVEAKEAVLVDEATLDAIMAAVVAGTDPTKITIPAEVKAKYPLAKVELVESTEITAENGKFYRLKLTLK